MSFPFPASLVHNSAGSAAVVILPDASLHTAALSAVYGLYRAIDPRIPVSGMTAEPAPALCGDTGGVPRFLLDRDGAWRTSPAAAVEQIVDVRCVHIVFEPLMPPEYLRDLVDRATNAANRIIAFATQEVADAAKLSSHRNIEFFGFLVPLKAIGGSC